MCEVRPTVMQCEVHPYGQQKELKAFLDANEIAIQAWYPLGHGDKALLQEGVFTELAEKYQKSNAQIILKWHVQAGNIVIPGSKNPGRYPSSQRSDVLEHCPVGFFVFYIEDHIHLIVGQRYKNAVLIGRCSSGQVGGKGRKRGGFSQFI